MMTYLSQHYRLFVSVLLLTLMTITSALAPQHTAVSAITAGMPVSLGEIEVEADRAANGLNQEEVMWLARVIYSETKRPHEQELVAWVVRNRVETGYRGNRSYKDAVLDTYQFSAFNPGTRTRSFYAGLDETSGHPGWKTALEIAEEVAAAPAGARPFKETTRHFYSEQSMKGRRAPAWASGKVPVKIGDRYVAPDRFRFYADVS